MRKILIRSIIVALFLLNTSSAFAELRPMTCANKIGSIVFVCSADMSCTGEASAGWTTTVYALKYKQTKSGAIDYSHANGADPKCHFVVSPMKKGGRKLTTAKCAKVLKGSTCRFDTTE